MIEAMTGAADAQDEVVEQPYEKSGAFIGGLTRLSTFTTNFTLKTIIYLKNNR